MRIPESDILRGRNKTLRQFQRNSDEKRNYTSVAIVLEVFEKKAIVKLIPTLTYTDYNFQEGFNPINTENEVVECLRVEGLNLIKDDVVVVVFTDMDSRQAIKDIAEGRKKSDNFNISHPDFHNSNFGIIINKIII